MKTATAAAAASGISDRARAVLASATICDMTLPWGNWEEGKDSILDRYIAQGFGFVSLSVGLDRMGFEETVRRVARERARLRAMAPRAELVDSVADIRRLRASGRLALGFHFQGSNPLGGAVDMVEFYYKLGIRHMLLAYNQKNQAADGCSERTDAGLSRYGLALIKEMNRVGMLIDMSHSAERTTREAIDLSARPIAITHANPTVWHESVRNKSDALLVALAARGGMLGLSLYPYHLKGGSSCPLDSFAEMAARLAERIGIDHIGIGSDLCQGHGNAIIEWMRVGRWTKAPPGAGLGAPVLPPQPQWFRDNRDWGKIRAGLLAHGFSEADASKILGGNWHRFFAASLAPMSVA